MNTQQIRIFAVVFFLSIGLVALTLSTANAMASDAGINHALSIHDVGFSEEDTAAPQEMTYVVSYTQPVNQIISDGSCGTFTATSYITVPDNAYVYAIQVGVIMSHSHRGDMQIFLVSPGAKEVKLIGQSTSNTNNFDVLFDSASKNPPEGPPGEGDHDIASPYHEYNWHPEGDFHDFYQDGSGGNWYLKFCDGTLNSETGKLIEWTLYLEL
jgi:hypothetical protein